MPAKHIFLGDYGPLDGMEEEFDRLWERHVSEAVNQIAGFVAGQRYRLAEHQRPGVPPVEQERLLIYELEGDDVDAIHEDNTRVRENGLYSPFAHTVRPGTMFHVYSPVGPTATTEGWGGRKDASAVIVVRTNPTPGREQDFETWYDAHLQEVVDAIDGYRGAQRFEINASQRPGMPSSPWRFVTIYELDDTPVERAIASHAEVTGQLTKSGGAVAPEYVDHAYVKVGERIVNRSLSTA